MKKDCSYTEIRHMIQDGDIIAFSGSGLIAKIITYYTPGYNREKGPISHVGIAYKVYDATLQPTIMLIEAVGNITNRSKLGVTISRLSDIVDEYVGNIYYLPLKRTLVKDTAKLVDYLVVQKGKAYDYSQAVLTGLSFLESIGLTAPQITADDSKVFCSELLVSGLIQANILPNNIIPAEINPLELCQLNIYEDDYYQLINAYNKGSVNIPYYNSVGYKSE